MNIHQQKGDDKISSTTTCPLSQDGIETRELRGPPEAMISTAITSPPPAGIRDQSMEEIVVLNKKITIQLFTSHFLSTWNSRLFEMGAVLFLAAVYPQTLLPISIYALSRNGAAIIFSTSIGTFIDTCDRLVVVRISILGQRAAVAASCGLFLVLTSEIRVSYGLQNGLFAILVLLGCLEKLCSMMNLVAVERDWVVAITQDQPSKRKTLNARMRRIDLFCKLLGPLVISLIDGASTRVAIWLTLGFTCFSVGIEYITIARIYKAVTVLQKRRPSVDSLPSATSDATNHSYKALFRRTMERIFPRQSLRFYVHHPAFLPSFALSLLYLTVLSFSGQMITYLLAAGYTSTYAGIARAVSTVFELSATWIASRLQNCIGPVRGGVWSVNWEAIFLTAGLVWFAIQGQHHEYQNIVTASGLVAGVILSRVGLWSFDLCVQIIIQEEVDEDQRGKFSTVEAAFQNLFELLSYVTTIVFAQPDQFVYPSIISTVAVYSAGGLYALFVRRRRGHLFHRPLCLKTGNG